MRKKYLLPQQKIVEIDEEELLCTSPGETSKESMKVEMNDYDTYQDKQRTNSVDWDGVGTGSDF